MHVRFALAAFLICTAQAAAQPAAAPRGSVPLTPAALHDSIESALISEGLVGAVWSTVSSDGGIRTDAAGLADAETEQKMRPEHRVHVGSVTKTVVALGVLRLVTDGKLSLDTRVSVLLPTLSVKNRWEARSPLRVRHLLDHTSGLDDAKLWQVLSLEPNPDTPLSEAFTRSAETLVLGSEPGTRFSYSNQGYTLLGMIIEKVTGQRYETYVDAEVLTPIGMSNSTLFFVTQTGIHADSTLVMGHFERGRTQPTIPQRLRPAAQFTTTAGDMARLGLFMMGDGTINDERLIAPELMTAIGSASGTEAANAGLTIGYSLGMSRRDRHGALGLCHSGNTVGFRAMFCVFRESKHAFFIAMNADAETANYGRFDGLLIRALAMPRIPETPARAVDNDLDDWSGVYVPNPRRFVISAYIDRVFSWMLVWGSENGFSLFPLQGSVAHLTPVGQHLYRAPGRRVASHALLFSADSARVLTDGTHSWVRISVWSMLPLWLNAILGVIGIFGLMLAAWTRIRRKAFSRLDPGFYPVVMLLALAIPVPFFLVSSFLAIGDLTAATLTTAIITGALPIALMYGIISNLRIGVMRTRAALRETFAMVAVLQWVVVLAAWGNVPLRLWQ